MPTHRRKVKLFPNLFDRRRRTSGPEAIVVPVGDVLEPRGGIAGGVGLLDGAVGHQIIRRGAVPVAFAGFEPHGVAGKFRQACFPAGDC